MMDTERIQELVMMARCLSKGEIRMARYGKNEDGTVSECNAQPQNVGRFGCHHAEHMDMTKAQADAINQHVVEETARNEASASKPSGFGMSKKARKTESNEGNGDKRIPTDEELNKKIIDFGGTYDTETFDHKTSGTYVPEVLSAHMEGRSLVLDEGLPDGVEPLRGHTYNGGDGNFNYVFEPFENASNAQIRQWVRDEGYNSFTLVPVMNEHLGELLQYGYYDEDDPDYEPEPEDIGWAVLMSDKRNDDNDSNAPVVPIQTNSTGNVRHYAVNGADVVIADNMESTDVRRLVNALHDIDYSAGWEADRRMERIMEANGYVDANHANLGYADNYPVFDKDVYGNGYLNVFDRRDIGNYGPARVRQYYEYYDYDSGEEPDMDPKITITSMPDANAKKEPIRMPDEDRKWFEGKLSEAQNNA